MRRHPPASRTAVPPQEAARRCSASAHQSSQSPRASHVGFEGLGGSWGRPARCLTRSCPFSWVRAAPAVPQRPIDPEVWLMDIARQFAAVERSRRRTGRTGRPETRGRESRPRPQARRPDAHPADRRLRPLCRGGDRLHLCSEAYRARRLSSRREQAWCGPHREHGNVRFHSASAAAHAP